MLKTTGLFNMPAFKKNNSNDKIVRFGVDGNIIESNKNSKWKLFKFKNPYSINATKEYNFLIFDAKTDFKSWSNFI